MDQESLLAGLVLVAVGLHLRLHCLLLGVLALPVGFGR